MKTYNEILDQKYDVSAILHPENWIYEKHHGVWYPKTKINALYPPTPQMRWTAMRKALKNEIDVPQTISMKDYPITTSMNVSFIIRTVKEYGFGTLVDEFYTSLTLMQF